MPLPLPDLDDRTFDDLMNAARRQIAQTTDNQWTDFSAGDPGTLLLELYAHLTETMIYRLNRLPEKVYVALLNLLGVTLRPPSAASVTLKFTLDRPAAQAVTIPRRVRVAGSQVDGSGQRVTFRTAQQLVIPDGQTEGYVLAYHYEYVEGELLGLGTGMPGLTRKVASPPIVDRPGERENALVVGIEARPGQLRPDMPARESGGKAYQVWRQADNFTDLLAYPYVYVVDRTAGTISFAPSQGWENGVPSKVELERARVPTENRQAHIPAAGREIRAWYWRGGGSAGNVPAGSLTTVMDSLSLPDGVRLTVTNPGPASGGHDAETLEEAKLRGPQALYTLPRGVITARDYENMALRSSPAIARATALTQADLWHNARPGTVEVLLVPDVPEIPSEERGNGLIDEDRLRNHQTPEVLDDCRASLEAVRTLGTYSQVKWARYKKVRVKAHIFVREEENAVAVRERVLRRLHEHINPLRTADGPGWAFGKDLQASDVYNIAMAEPGVRWVERVRLVLDEVPEQNVCTLAADHYQPRTWYAGSDATLFRSLNRGESWERAEQFKGETIRQVLPHPGKSGRIVALTSFNDAKDGGLRLHLSRDYGETWKPEDIFSPRFDTPDSPKEISGMVWSLGHRLAVLLATDKGLYEFELGHVDEKAKLAPLYRNLPNDDAKQKTPVYAVATIRTSVVSAETTFLAVVTKDGVHISDDGGLNFGAPIKGPRGDEDIQKLAFQEAGGLYLWAGTAAAKGQEGHGCLRLRLGTGKPEPLEPSGQNVKPGSAREKPATGATPAGSVYGRPEDWESFGQNVGWKGGSCNQLAFLATKVLAATHHQGVLVLDTTESGRPRWKVPDVETCGLPPRGQPGPFQPVAALATNWNRDNPPDRQVTMAGVVREIERQEGEGVYRSLDEGGEKYEFISRREFPERVTLPPTWLFVSGKHEVKVVNEGREGQ
jgi:hypothetical protein